MKETSWPQLFDQLMEADLAEIDRLKEAFWWTTNQFIERAQQEIELARAMKDREALVKEQIKLGVMKHAQGIFQNCYLQVTERRVWDE
jgi:hypothetical protein